MIPAFVDGQLPPGRYRCSLEEVHAQLVAATDFASSETRMPLWTGLLRYLQDWERVHITTEKVLLERLWIAGSFASSELNPQDVDVSPILDRAALDDVSGRPGSGMAKKLFTSRKDVRRRYGVEPFVILRQSSTTIMMKNLTSTEYEYLAMRGLFDDFWLRQRHGSAKSAMTESECLPRRGYLEVDPWL